MPEINITTQDFVTTNSIDYIYRKIDSTHEETITKLKEIDIIIKDNDSKVDWFNDIFTKAIDELNTRTKEIETKNNLAIFFACVGIMLAIISAFVNLWFTSSETRRLSKIEFDDEKYIVEHNYSTMYSEISTITDNETGKKYIVIQTPNGTIVEDKETSERISSEDLK